MANWAVDPRPFVPKGFSLIDRSDRPPIRQEVYVIGCYTRHNEDLAIVKLQPPVDKADFPLLSEALREFFLVTHGVHVGEISPCPLGDAYVRFNTALEREKFLGPVFRFRNAYNMYLIKHDEADNACSFDLDREAWVLLLGYPNDLKYDSVLATTVSGFGMLVDWFGVHEPGKVVVKVYLHDDAKIPDDVKVNVGLPVKGQSFSTAVFLLKKNNLNELPDEEAYVTFGPLHPISNPAPRWIGEGTGGSSSHSAPPFGPGGSAMVVDGPTVHTASGYQSVVIEDRWRLFEAPTDDLQAPTGPQLISQNTPRMRSVIVGPALPQEPLIPIIPSLIRQHFGENSLEKLALDYPELEVEEEDIEVVHGETEAAVELPEEASSRVALTIPSQAPAPLSDSAENSDLEMLDEAPSVFKTPLSKKKKATKVENLLESSFFRRSKRIADRLGGFKTAEEAKAHQGQASAGDIGGPSDNKKAKAKKESKRKQSSNLQALEEALPPPLT